MSSLRRLFGCCLGQTDITSLRPVISVKKGPAATGKVDTRMHDAKYKTFTDEDQRPDVIKDHVQSGEGNEQVSLSDWEDVEGDKSDSSSDVNETDKKQDGTDGELKETPSTENHPELKIGNTVENETQNTPGDESQGRTDETEMDGHSITEEEAGVLNMIADACSQFDTMVTETIKDAEEEPPSADVTTAVALNAEKDNSDEVSTVTLSTIEMNIERPTYTSTISVESGTEMHIGEITLESSSEQGSEEAQGGRRTSSTSSSASTHSNSISINIGEARGGVSPAEGNVSPVEVTPSVNRQKRGSRTLYQIKRASTGSVNTTDKIVLVGNKSESPAKLSSTSSSSSSSSSSTSDSD